MILSPIFTNTWKNNHNKPPVTTITNGQYGGEFIGIYLKFHAVHKRGKIIKGKYLKLFLFPSTTHAQMKTTKIYSDTFYFGAKVSLSILRS